VPVGPWPCRTDDAQREEGRRADRNYQRGEAPLGARNDFSGPEPRPWLRRTPTPSRPRLLLAEAALRLSRWLIATAERCRRWPGIGLAMLFVYKHVAAFARRVLSARPPWRRGSSRQASHRSALQCGAALDPAQPLALSPSATRCAGSPRRPVPLPGGVAERHRPAAALHRTSSGCPIIHTRGCQTAEPVRMRPISKVLHGRYRKFRWFTQLSRYFSRLAYVP